MSTGDSFGYGKKGRRLSEAEQLVRRLNTWHRKTLEAKCIGFGINPAHFKTREQLIVEVAAAMLKRQKVQS